ncbi:MAG TPA: chorismate lyase [Saccharospirillum sp.]|nr:chorismate lyase [Saccharospirillum sp.]
MTVVSQALDMRHYDWYAPDELADQLPAPWQYWLELPGSLTRALRERSDAFSVQVLAEGNLTLSTPLAAFAGQADALSCWSRQVALCHGNTPWVLAHTLVTQASLADSLTALTRLNNRPLGELLFTTPGVRKDQQQVTRTQHGWGRRTRYWLHGAPVLVAEFFMETLLNHEYQRLSTLP